MGGAVAAVAKPIKKLVGGESANIGGTVVQPIKDVQKASRMDEEQGARMRGARRRGRQLLSDARLNPEAGMQETLGGGNNLG